jgi:hypothetical protein
MKPTVGRIIHWVEDFGEVCQAALVIATNDGPDTNCPNEPDLAVFGASADSAFSLVAVDRRVFAPPGKLSDEDPPRWSHGWHWPEREPDA